MPLDEYVDKHFYQPMGLGSICFNPWKKLSKTRTPPTEKDAYFRRQEIKGYVHDMGAAMMGGVAGHAGLFSNVNDLAVVLEMLLQQGSYGGVQYLSAETVKLFTSRHPNDNRRGLGFDMKQTNPLLDLNMSDLAPESVFGHLGFTGTCAWADPQNNMVYIFLSNRTYPSMKNYKLIKNKVRPKIHTAIYKAIEDFLPESPNRFEEQTAK